MADGNDTRIVQMQFDNKNFEKNIATSQKSLDRFKSALDFEGISKGLKDFVNSTKNLAFDTLSSNIQKLTDKFTGLGNVGEFVLSKIRGTLEDLASKAMSFVDSMTTVQMSAGFTKYESLNKAVQTLKSATGKEEKEVYDVLERLNKYTDETSYDFAEGVTTISKLVSSGAADMATAEKTVEGFFNLAAKAGADTTQASHALQYSINQAMGTGYMGLNDWKTLESMNIATIDFKDQLLEAAVAVGTVTKENDKYYVVSKKGTKQTKKEVNATTLWRESLSEQWVTTKVLNTALGKYQDTTQEFGAEAYAAAQRCTTFTDALNAWKDMLSTGWMTTYRTVFGDLSDAMNLFSGVCNKVSDALSGLVDTRNKVLEAWKAVGGRNSLFGALFGEIETPDGEKLFEGAYGILDAIEDIGNVISEAYWQTMMNLIPREEQNKILSFVNDNLSELGLEKPFEDFAALYNSDFFKESGGREGLLGGALQGITQDVQNFIGKIRDFFNEIDTETGLTRMEKITNVLTAIGRTVAFIFEVIGGIAHFFEVLADENHLGPSLEIIGNLLHSLGLSLIDAENGVSESGGIPKFFETLADILKPACEIINLVVGAIADLITAIVDGEKENQNIGSVIRDVGNALRDVFNFLMKFVGPFATFISEVSHIVGDLFRDGFTPEGLEAAKERLGKAFSNLWTSLKAIFAPIIQKVGEFFRNLWEEIKKKATEYFNNPETLGYKIITPLKKVLGPVWNFLADGFNRIKEFFMKIIDAFKGGTLFDVLKVIFSENMLGGFVKRIKEWVSGTNLYSLILAFLGGFALFKLIKLIKSWTEVGDGLGELVEKIKHPIKSLMGNVGDEVESFGAKFLDFAKGVALVAASVVVLGSMGWQSALTGFLALIGIIGIVWGAVKLFEKTTKSIGLTEVLKMIGSFVPIIGAFIGFAASMILMAAALKIIGSMEWDQLAKGLVGLGGILLELIGFMILTSKLPIGTGQLGGFIGFAFSIALLVFALKPLKDMSWDQYGKMLAGFGGILLELIAFMLLTSALPIGTGQLGRFIGFALSVGILILALQPLKDMSWDQFGKMMAGLGGVLLELIALMVLTEVLPANTKLKSFIGFALSIAILIQAIKPFTEMTWEQYAKAMAGLGGVLLEILAFMGIFKLLGLETNALKIDGIIGFVAALTLLVYGIKPFAEMSWDQYARVMAGLGGVLLEILAFMEIFKLLGLSTKALNFAGIILFVASLWLLIQAILPFAKMSWDEYGRTMAGLGGVLLELIGFMALLNLVPVDPIKIAAALALAVGLGLIALAVSFALNEVRNLKWETITAFTTGLAATIIAMAGAIAILSAVPLVGGIKAISLLALAITAIVGVIALLGPALINSMGDSLTQLSGKLELVSGLLKGFADRMGTVDEGNIDKAGTIFDKLKILMRKLTGWGQFTGDLNNFAYSMFVLGTGMEIFNNHVGNVAGDLDSNAQTALKFIQDLSGCASDLDTIAKMNLDNLIAAIAGLGGAMSIYAYGAKEVQGMLAPGESPDEGTVSRAIAILQSVSTGLAEAGGFTLPGNMPDEQSLSLFGASLAALATAMVKFEQAGSGLGSGTANALRCLTFFKDLKAELIKQDFAENLGAAIGIFEKNEIKKDKLTEFATNIEQLGLAMAAFNNSVTILDENTGERKAIDFSNAVGTLDSLVELQGKLGWEFGPVIQFFAGRTKDFTDLGGQLEALGTALADFTTKLGGVDDKGQPMLDTKLFDDAIAIADKIVGYLTKLKEKFGNVGGLWNILGTFFNGRDYTFTDLQKQIEDLAKGLGSLGQLKTDDKLITADETTGIFKVLDSIIAYMKSLKTKMGKVGGLFNTVITLGYGRDYNFTDLKKQLNDLSEGLVSLSAVDASGLPTKEEMETAFPMIDSLIEYMNSLKNKIGGGEGSNTVGGIYNTVNTLLHGRTFDFQDLGGQLSALGNGLKGLDDLNIDDKGNSIFNPEKTPAVITMIDGMVSYMNQISTKLPSIGGAREFFESLWEGKAADFDYIGGQLGHLGEGLGKFYKAVSTEGGDYYDPAILESSLGAMSNLVSVLKKMATMNDLLDDTEITDGFSTTVISNIGEYMYKLSLALDYMSQGNHELGSGHQFDSIAGKLATFVNEFKGLLDEFGGAESLKSASDVLNNISVAIANLVTAAKNMTSENGSTVDFSNIGYQICNGIVEGILNGQSGVITAAANMAAAAYAAACAELGIESPSRKFMEIGKYVGEGFAQGMIQSEGGVSSAAEAIANATLEGAGGMMAKIAQLMSQDINANPTITPVLDMSNLTAGSEFINGLFNGTKTLNLSGAGSDYSSRTVPHSDRTTQEVNSPDLSWINSSITNLGNRIDQMANKISNLQIVLNTGALVGGISDGINQSLGQATVYSRRRN